MSEDDHEEETSQSEARGEEGDDQRGLYLADRCDDWQGTEVPLRI